MNFKSASIWSAVIFAFIHFRPTGFLGHLFFGLITAYLIKVTESICSTIIVHMVTNALMITIGFLIIKYPVVNEIMTNTHMSYTLAFYLCIVFLAAWCIKCLMQSVKRDYPKHAVGDGSESNTYEMTFEELKAYKQGGSYALWKGQNFQMPLGAILTLMPFVALFALFAYRMYN